VIEGDGLTTPPAEPGWNGDQEPDWYTGPLYDDTGWHLDLSEQEREPQRPAGAHDRPFPHQPSYEGNGGHPGEPGRDWQAADQGRSGPGERPGVPARWPGTATRIPVTRPTRSRADARTATRTRLATPTRRARWRASAVPIRPPRSIATTPASGISAPTSTSPSTGIIRSHAATRSHRAARRPHPIPTQPRQQATGSRIGTDSTTRPTGMKLRPTSTSRISASCGSGAART
jgi:hypothetical protein